MNGRRGLARAARLSIGAFASLTTAACASTVSGGGAGSEPVEQVTMARNLRDTEQPFRDVFAELEAIGLAPLVGTAEFGPCGDQDDGFVPTVTGQLRYTDGRSPSEADASEVRDAVVAAGWGLDESDPFVDGIASTPDGWEIGMFGYEFADVTLRVELHSAAPEVDVTATGSCLPATEDEREFYDAMGTWYLNNLAPNEPPVTSPSGTS